MIVMCRAISQFIVVVNNAPVNSPVSTQTGTLNDINIYVLFTVQMLS